MKKIVSVMLVAALALVALVGCGEGEPTYTHSPNDGHIHSYIHDLKNDEYICSLCGEEFKGDPSRLVEK